MLAAGLGLLAVGVAGWLAAGDLPQASAELVGGNRPLNPGAASRLETTGMNSPAVADNPIDADNLVVAARVNTPRFGCGLFASIDGGASWQPTPVPAREDSVVGCFAPDVAFGAGGRLFLSFTSFAEVEGQGVVPEAIWLATSTDGGRTLSDPRRVAGALSFQVRLAADPTRPGRLVLAWVRADAGVGAFGFRQPGNPVVVSLSTDAGQTWSEPTTVAGGGDRRLIAPTPVVGPDGQVVVGLLDVGGDRLDYRGAHQGLAGPPYQGPWRLLVARPAGADAAGTAPAGNQPPGGGWQEVQVGQVRPTRRVLMLFPPLPSLAADHRRGRLYAAFHGARHGDSDVWVWRSADAGASWQGPARVNDTPVGDGTAQHLPALAVAPTGRLDVLYYDRRADPEDSIMTEVSLSSSFDGGQSFTDRLAASTTAFDARIGHHQEGGIPELGDRLGLVSRPGGALAVWADTRAGEQATGRQDLARAVIAIDGPSRLAGPLRAAGAVVAGLGLLLAARGARPDRGRRRARITARRGAHQEQDQAEGPS